MKSLFQIVLVAFVLSACSKAVVNNKILDGTWLPDKLTIGDYDGIKSKETVTGTMRFESDGKGSERGKYTFDLYFNHLNTPVDMVDHGTYFIENGNIVQLVSTGGDTTEMTIVYRTKGDLLLNFPNVSYRSYDFVMKKEN